MENNSNCIVNNGVTINSQKKKLCFAASSGGHFEQISMLKPLMEKYESCVVTEKTQYSARIQGQ